MKQNELQTVAAQQHAQAVIPDGWVVRKTDDGDIVVSKHGIGGYSAHRDDDNIASSILHAFASDIIAAPQKHAQAAQSNSREFDRIATTQEIRAVASSPEITDSSIAQAALYLSSLHRYDVSCEGPCFSPNDGSYVLYDDLVALISASQQPAAAPAAPAFPARDNTLAAEQQGIFEKFAVRRNDGSDAPGGKHHGCAYFVLDLDHDQHASAAMIAYAASCRVTHPQLAADIVTRYPAAPAIEPMEDPVTVPRGLLGAACHAIVNKKDAPNTLEKLRSFILAKGPAEPAAQVQERAAIPDYGVERPELLHALYRAFQRGDSVERAHAAICKILAAPAPIPPAPVAADLVQRAIGRAEAMRIIMDLNAEDGIDEYIGTHPSGDSGEWDAYWKDDRLRDLLRVDDAAWSLVVETEHKLIDLQCRIAEKEMDKVFCDDARPVADVAQGKAHDFFAEFCEREDYPSDGPFDAALRKAFDAGCQQGRALAAKPSEAK